MYRTIVFFSLVLFGHMLLGSDIGAYVVVDAVSGHVLTEKLSNEKMYPASLTKMVFISYILSTPGLDLNQKLVVPKEAVRQVSDFEKKKDNFSAYPSYVLQSSSSSASLKVGEILSVKDAVMASMLHSANDAANTLAYYWGDRSIEKCVEKVNRFADSLGCTDTHFCNPHGLHHPEHISTAQDLAILAKFAMKNPLFREVVKTPSYVKEKNNKQPRVTWKQTNLLVAHGPFCYKYATGIKTGYHSHAERCLVASANNGDRSLIAVLLKCQDKKQIALKAREFFEHFLAEKKISKTFVQKGSIPLRREISGHKIPLSLRAEKAFSYSYYPSQKPVVTVTVEWENIEFPLCSGQKVGKLHVVVDREEMATISLLSAEGREKTWRQVLLEKWQFCINHPIVMGGLAVFVFGLFFSLLRRRSANRW